MKSFHFSCGDSTDGPIGFCARVQAEDVNDAVQKLKDALGWLRELDAKKASGMGNPAIEYLEIYFNPEAITWKAIDEEDEIPVHPEAQ